VHVRYVQRAAHNNLLCHAAAAARPPACLQVFSGAELHMIAALCQRHDCLVLLDEVYEHLVHPGAQHISLRSLPGMADRCLRIGSAGKTFSYTGWKVGWLTGPREMVAAVAKAHQFLTFTVSPALQVGTAGVMFACLPACLPCWKSRHVA
jgi:aspartate/methionine/tyrosine aminotransferase